MSKVDIRYCPMGYGPDWSDWRINSDTMAQARVIASVSNLLIGSQDQSVLAKVGDPVWGFVEDHNVDIDALTQVFAEATYLPLIFTKKLVELFNEGEEQFASGIELFMAWERVIAQNRFRVFYVGRPKGDRAFNGFGKMYIGVSRPHRKVREVLGLPETG